MSIDLHPMGDPSSRGWGTGWPNCQTAKMVRLSEEVPFVGGVRREVHDLMALLLAETARRGYHYRSPGCWGFACRAIPGTNTGSLHSWGLAIDINAPDNPRLTRMVTDMPAWMPKLWNVYGFRWGGDYRAPTLFDPMHYEFMGNPADAATMTAKARADFAVKPNPRDPEEDEMSRFMYLASNGQAVLVQDGKQIALEPTAANEFSTAGVLYVNSAKATVAQEHAYAAAWGPVNR